MLVLHVRLTSFLKGGGANPVGCREGGGGVEEVAVADANYSRTGSQHRRGGCGPRVTLLCSPPARPRLQIPQTHGQRVQKRELNFEPRCLLVADFRSAD